jgi:hypothetical protein
MVMRGGARSAGTEWSRQKGLGAMAHIEERSIAMPNGCSDLMERENQCRTALKASFEALALSAERAGWDADETALALLRLAGAHVNERVTNSVALAAVRSNQRAFATERRGRWVLE